jgi:hypothetical protein
MGLVIADRVQETTTTTGTGTINLAGATSQNQSFVSGVGSTNQCNYCLLSGNGTDWETGVGTVTSGSPNTLSRSSILASSNSNAAINLSGTSIVFLTEPAAALKNRLSAPIVPPTAAANWTQRFFGGSATLTDVANGVSIFDSSTVTSHVVRGFTISSPSTPYTIDANLSSIALVVPAGGNFFWGIGWTDATKIEAVCAEFTYNSQQSIMQTATYATNTSSPSQATNSNFFATYNPADVWLRIADDGTNISTSLSADGTTWFKNYTVAKSSGFLGSSGYSNVGVFIDSGPLGNGGNCVTTLRSWYQH